MDSAGKRGDIVDRLASRNRAIRADAERELEGLSADDLDALYVTLQRNDRRLARYLLAVLVAFGLAEAALGLLFPSVLHRPEWRSVAVPAALGALVSLAIVLAVAWSRASVRRKAMGRAAEVGDVRSVPYLVRRQRLQADAERFLADLLPRVQPRHAEAARSLVRGLDYPLLARAWSPEFVIAALQALSRCGDRSVLWRVERFAAGKGRTGRDPRVKEVARECADELRARLEAERTHATLLRPASAPTDTLLRPASAPRDADTERLLRPAQPEGEGAQQAASEHAAQGQIE